MAQKIINMTDVVIPAKLPKDYKFNPLPKGWYVIALSEEVPQGKILERKFMNQDLVVFRTWDNNVAVIDAYCPHMGAHFAHGGTIEKDNTIKCPFHGFCFDTKGKCTKTGYGTKPSPRAVVKSWPVKEMHGIILCYHHPTEETPAWEVPDLSFDGWSKVLYKEWTMRANSQETAENAVDVGHFFAIHKYEDVEVLEPLVLDNHILTAGYAMSRSASTFGKKNQRFRAEFKIVKYGLGYSVVEAHVTNYNLITRHFVFVTPIDKETVYLRIGASLKNIESRSKVNPALVILPKRLVNKIIHRAVFKGYQNDVSQDFKIWNNKKYVHPPALAQGDGPIMEYRAWAHQFD